MEIKNCGMCTMPNCISRNLSSKEDCLLDEKLSANDSFDFLEQSLAKFAIDFAYKGKTLKECLDKYKFNIIAAAHTIEPTISDIVDEHWWEMLGEEPISESLEEVAHQYYKPNETFMDGFKKGANWQKANLWKLADGDDLPEIDREVVVFTQNFPDDAGIMSVAVAHRPNPNGWDGKSVTTGKVEHYTPKTYGKGGWNIPDIVYWLDVELPKEIEL